MFRFHANSVEQILMIWRILNEKLFIFEFENVKIGIYFYIDIIKYDCKF